MLEYNLEGEYMKGIKKLVLIVVSFMAFSGIVKANRINSITMDIYIDSKGDATVTETWDYKSNENTEIYHSYYDIGNASITDFSVSDSTGAEYEYQKWNVKGSFDSKAYKYGYNYTKGGVELCLGISHYGTYTYYLKYKINGFVAQLNDSQMVYWTLLPKTSENLQEYYIKIHSDFKYSDDLPVWGFGDEGAYAYVYDGVIEMSDNGKLKSDEYVVLLAKFDNNTFETENILDKDFDHYLEMAKEGATEYKNNKIADTFGTIMVIGLQLGFYFIIGWGIYKAYRATERVSKKIIPKNAPMFRDLPCKEDIFRAYFIANEYHLTRRKTDFLGALLLKWIKLDYISVTKNEKGKTVIIFNKLPQDITFEKNVEQDMYEIMHMASKENKLEEKAFEKYCSNHYNRILKWFDKTLDAELNTLVSDNLVIYNAKKKTVATDRLNELAMQMSGLKRFFKEFGNIQDKNAIEVKLWREYLMYAQILGVANKVAKEFKKMYPEEIYDQDLDNVILLNHFYTSATNAASTAKSRAESYSSGGGGFSSGGGGGGSFGGGGSMGSR